MQLLHEGLGGDAGVTTSTAFRVDMGEFFNVWLVDGKDAAGITGWNGGTITMEICPSNTDSDYRTFTTDTIDQEWTANDGKTYLWVGGGWFRFSADGVIDDVDIYVGGPGVTIIR